jgi:hypothetical protein
MPPIVRVIDPATGNSLCRRAEVHFVTDTGQHPAMRRVVAGQTTDPNEISLRFAQAIESDAQRGRLRPERHLGGDLVFRGLWVRQPAGYTAVVRAHPPT